MLTLDSWTRVSGETTGYNSQTHNSKMVFFPRRVRYICFHATKTEPGISFKDFPVRRFDISETRL